MYTTTLFLTLSALVARAAPNMPPADTSIIDSETPKVVSYAGAPADGEYPDQITDMGGYEADAPTYDPSAATVVWSTTIAATGSMPTGATSSMPTHGSGSMPATDMNSCYQMCQAQYGGAGLSAPPSVSAPPSSGSAPPSQATSVAAGATGAPAPPANGTAGSKTHTIIVAPTQGVLRFVPFAVKAQQGDTLEYIWGGGPHTATLSDGSNVCNKSTEAGAFDSGKLNATATFSTVYEKNTTGPTFYYCTVGQHCANGMFGIINPPSSNVSNALTDKATSKPPRPDSTAGSGSSVTPGVDGWITSWGLTNPDNQKKIDAVKAQCKTAPGSWAWGSNWDWDSMLSNTVTKEVIVENTLYTRLMASYNPAMLSDGALPKDWKAAPDLTSFAASYTRNTTASISPSNAGTGAGSGSGSSSATPPSADPSTAAGLAASANGAGGRAGTSVGFVLLAGFAGAVFSWF